MKKRLSALLLAGVMALSLSVPAFAEEKTEAPIPTAEEAALQAAQYAMTYGGATAVQYAVWQDGKITLSGHSGVYSKTENRALTDTDLFGIGSVSKVYTAAAVMKLVEQGKINLDSPVTKYIPTFKMADERYKQITVRMLINHSSGLMGGSTNDAFLFADTDQVATDDLLERLSTQRLKADPGEIAVYCNDGFTLAELVVEAVSGQDFGTFIHENLLKSAGLNNTFVPQDEFDTSRLVKTYASAEDTKAQPQDMLGIVGAGGIYASASDLAAFGGALTGTTILSQKSTAAMANAEYKKGLWPADDADMIAYGLGWDSVKVYPFAASGIQGLSKVGDTQCYHAVLVVIPEYKMAAAVLTSGGVSTYNQLAASRMLLDALKAKGVAVDETPLALPEAAPAAMPGELMGLSGNYGNFAQQFKVEVAAEGILTMKTTGVPDQVYHYYSDGSFRDESGQSVMIKLVTEKNGNTYFYQKTCGALPGLTYIPTSQYAAQCIPENTVDAETKAAWDAYNTKVMLPVNMKYSSQLYPVLVAALATPSGALPEAVPGYVGGLRIVSPTLAESVFQIPNTAGRDSQDMTIYEKAGVTYMTTTQGILYREMADMTSLYVGGGSYSTVGEEGYARWYSVSAKDAGRQISIACPANAGFYVYDATGAVVASSVLYGDKTATLPENGLVVFAGDPGSRFVIAP